jgi:hypothetical protein
MGGVKYEPQESQKRIYCPYCETCKNEYVHEGDSIIFQCTGCKKLYRATSEIRYIATADCTLNGGEHQREEGGMTSCCTVCGMWGVDLQ